MEIAAHILIVSAAPLTMAIVFAVNAKKLNAQWRERRAARADARG